MYTHLQLRGTDRPPVTLSTLARMKADKQKIASLTCYDASFAVLLDEADVDVVLVGDSMGMVIQGTTRPCRSRWITSCTTAAPWRAATPSVSHGRPTVHELPVEGAGAREFRAPHAGRRLQYGEAGMRRHPGRDRRVAGASRYCGVRAPGPGDPSLLHKTGGFRVQGREQDAAAAMIDAAKRLESAGADIVLLECIPNELGKAVTEALSVPVIGIGMARHRWADSRALRHSRHHHRTQAAIRAELHTRCRRQPWRR